MNLRSFDIAHKRREGPEGEFTPTEPFFTREYPLYVKEDKSNSAVFIHLVKSL